MAFENNVPSIVNPVVDGLRDISARRAATISNMIDEAAKHGLDDQFAYDAVWTYGADNGKEFAQLEIHFHYCPYVTEWVKQSKNPEQIARLCDVAMAGDHAFAQEFSCLDFTLEGTIAKGDPVCTLRFVRRKDHELAKDGQGFIKTKKAA